MVSVPPSGMASLEFRERFMIARPISPGSALTCQSAGSQSTATLICSPTRRRSIRSNSATMTFRSRTFGCRTCRRLKASNCCVSEAALSPALLISSTCWTAGSLPDSVSIRRPL